MPDQWWTKIGDLPRKEFYDVAALGLIHGVATKTLHGYNADIDQAAETIWPGGSLYEFPVSAEILSISSTDDADAVGEIGAHEILVSGLDENYVIQQELVTLTGITPVLTTGSYLRVNDMSVTITGTNRSNVGTITALNLTNPISIINQSHGISSGMVFTVPVNTVALTKEWFVDMEGNTSHIVYIAGRSSIEGGPEARDPVFHINETSPLTIQNIPPGFLSEKMDFDVVGLGADGQNITVSAKLGLILFDKRLITRE